MADNHLAAPFGSGAHDALSRLARGAAAAAERRPKATVFLWLLLVVACVVGGATVGTRSLTSTQSEVGQSAKADAIIDHAGLRNPAIEDILVTSSHAAATTSAAEDVRSRLSVLPAVTMVRGPDQVPAYSRDGGRVQLLEVTLRGNPDDASAHVTSVLDAVSGVQRSHPAVKVQESGSGSQDKAINDLIGHDLATAEHCRCR